jgi:prepilin peptidase CpaA
MSALALSLALVAVAIAAVTDVRRGIIPNAVTLPLLAIGVVLHGIAAGPAGLGWALVGALVSGLIPYLAFRSGGMGGGDVKLFAALGAVLGAAAGIEVVFVATVVAAVQAVVMLAVRGQLGPVLRNTLRLLVRPFSRSREPVPTTALTELRMGPAIMLATLWVVLA